jgi:phosphonoacetate hydrolase
MLLGGAALLTVGVGACGGDADETTVATCSGGGTGGAAGGSSPAGGAGGVAPPIAFLGFEGDYGDIGIRFELAPADGQPRTVSLDYRGCSVPEWTPTVLLDAAVAVDLAPGEHALTWASWEQEAGCGAEVIFQLTTVEGERAESWPLALANVGAQSGFVSLPQGEQGIGPSELGGYGEALQALLSAPALDFVATRIGSSYEVRAARGSVVFTRSNTNRGYRYDVLEVAGQNPIEIQDPSLFPTLAEELARGSNPNDVSYPPLGYDAGDPRLSFIEPEDDSYPYGYERIAAYFDHPDAADLMVNYRGYAQGSGGHHGSLAMVQSRCPLILWGKGIEPGEKPTGSRQVDVAATVARLLGMPFVDGVDERGIRSHFVRLRWQDGHEIPGVLDGSVSSYVILIQSDGLNHAELHDKINRDPTSVPHLAQLRGEGAWLRDGSITNWPSVTYPSHNVVGSGLYSGHHGVVDNTYYLRATAAVANPIGEVFNTGHYWNPVLPEGETLHQALHRAFGNWLDDPATGAYTLSVLDPSVAGANTADLEFHDDSGLVSFPLDTLLPPLETPWPNVYPTDVEAFGAQVAERSGMAELDLLYSSSSSPTPTYTALNHMCTDPLGHSYGPHGDSMNQAIEHLDANVGVLLDWLDSWGILGETTILLTSDHGMQLGDDSRAGSIKQSLLDAGIAFVDGTSSMSVYLQ